MSIPNSQNAALRDYTGTLTADVRHRLAESVTQTIDRMTSDRPGLAHRLEDARLYAENERSATRKRANGAWSQDVLDDQVDKLISAVADIDRRIQSLTELLEMISTFRRDEPDPLEAA